MSQTPPSTKRATWWSWIHVSEVVGVLALVVAALGFWDNHNEHRQAERDRLAAEQRAVQAPAFVLEGVADTSGARVTLRPARDDQVIQSQAFYFPRFIRGQVVQITGAARIESDWIAQGLRKIGARSGPDAGDLRVPVGVSTTYLLDGDLKTDQSLYDLGYRLGPKFLGLGPARVVLEGLSVVRRDVRGDLQAATDQEFSARSGPRAP